MHTNVVSNVKQSLFSFYELCTNFNSIGQFTEDLTPGQSKMFYETEKIEVKMCVAKENGVYYNTMLGSQNTFCAWPLEGQFSCLTDLKI